MVSLNLALAQHLNVFNNYHNLIFNFKNLLLMSFQHRKKGSEWRKWDLHIHSPASFHWKGGKKMQDMLPDEINVEMEKFIDTINNSDVAVFCLMDYWTFDWYLVMRDYLEKNPGKLTKTIFPGMELRIECPVDYRLNIHCILSDKLSKQELIDFKSELYIRSIDKKLSNDSLIKFAKSLDESKALKHGFAAPRTLPDHELLKLGAQTAEITKDSLTKAFRQIPPVGGFVLLPYDTSDGLLKLNWEAHPHDDNYFMQSAHIFETRISANIDLISGIRTNQNEKIFDNFFKTLGGKPKPCVSGSDAHKYDDYGNFPSNKITWIKADPSFEGLKQIIFEPNARVEIASINPQIKNKKFQLSSIELTNSIGFPISNQVIDINRDMVSIIGGRGSGKSALLESIAYCFDQHSSFGFDKNERYDNGKRYDTNSFIDHYRQQGGNYELKLIFKDLDGNDLPPFTVNLQNRTQTCTYPILYLGQNKIEEFANSPDDIHKLALDTVSKNTSHSDALTLAHKSIEAKQRQLISLNAEIAGIRANITAFNPSELIAERDRIANELQLLTSAETKAAIDEFNMARTKREFLSKLEAIIGNIEQRAPESFGSLDQLVKSFQAQVMPLLASIESLKMALEINTPLVELDLSSFQNSINEIKENINKEQISSDYSIALQQIDKKLKGKTDLSVSYLENQRSRGSEVQNKILQLTELQSNLSSKLKERHLLLAELPALAEAYRRLYQTAIDEFYFKNVEILKSVKLQANIHFEVSKLVAMLYDYADKRKARSYNDFAKDFLAINDLRNFNFLDWINSFKADSENFSVFNGLSEDKFDELIYKNHYELVTDISYEIAPNDLKPLRQLSLGQKGTVLLKFYLSSGNNCPIFIDQPEDHLDNDFIYRDLVKTIRAAKIKRQIIVVTHDANIVVNGDSEQVIVAQYNDQKISHSVSGALENPDIKNFVSRILEGGEEAFKKREMKYSYL